MINRGTVLVRPKQPFLDWAMSVDEEGAIPAPDDERTVYLIPTYHDDIEAMDILSRGFEGIFEEELEAWHPEESAWPSPLSWRMFQEWFEVELNSMVVDLCGFPLEDDDEEDDQY